MMHAQVCGSREPWTHQLTKVWQIQDTTASTGSKTA